MYNDEILLADQTPVKSVGVWYKRPLVVVTASMLALNAVGGMMTMMHFGWHPAQVAFVMTLGVPINSGIVYITHKATGG